MRLAFQHFGSDFWVAGNAFLQNMFLALRTLGPDCPALVLVVGDQTPELDYRALTAEVDQVVRAPAQGPDQAQLNHLSLREHLAWWLRTRLWHEPARPAQHPTTDVLTNNHIDGYITLAWTEAPVTSVPSVIWLPDFQHRRLPDNFEPAEIAARDRIFALQARTANRLMVTSESVRRDLEAFDASQAGKARLISYVADVPAELYSDDPRQVVDKYHLPEKFIYLPNQFWAHKNHRLVFETLARLRESGVCPCVVSTGSPIDYRRPAHFGELMQLLSRLNIRRQFIYLGQVPRVDVLRLIRQSVCVLNPSTFEGLGLSVAESKSIGKQVLVSNLPSLREQAAPGAVYFNPNEPDDLADKLERVWTATAAGPDHVFEAAARAELPRRQAAFGRALLGLFQDAQADFGQ